MAIRRPSSMPFPKARMATVGEWARLEQTSRPDHRAVGFDAGEGAQAASVRGERSAVPRRRIVRGHTREPGQEVRLVLGRHAALMRHLVRHREGERCMGEVCVHRRFIREWDVDAADAEPGQEPAQGTRVLRRREGNSRGLRQDPREGLIDRIARRARVGELRRRSRGASSRCDPIIGKRTRADRLFVATRSCRLRVAGGRGPMLRVVLRDRKLSRFGVAGERSSAPTKDERSRRPRRTRRVHARCRAGRAASASAEACSAFRGQTRLRPRPGRSREVPAPS